MQIIFQFFNTVKHPTTGNRPNTGTMPITLALASASAFFMPFKFGRDILGLEDREKGNKMKDNVINLVLFVLSMTTLFGILTVLNIVVAIL